MSMPFSYLPAYTVDADGCIFWAASIEEAEALEESSILQEQIQGTEAHQTSYGRMAAP